MWITLPERSASPCASLGPLFAAHRGECRVIYRIIDQGLVIEVVSIVHRREAYRS